VCDRLPPSAIAIFVSTRGYTRAACPFPPAIPPASKASAVPIAAAVLIRGGKGLKPHFCPPIPGEKSTEKSRGNARFAGGLLAQPAATPTHHTHTTAAEAIGSAIAALRPALIGCDPSRHTHTHNRRLIGCRRIRTSQKMSQRLWLHKASKKTTKEHNGTMRGFPQST
jgi:hypothetical protein